MKSYIKIIAVSLFILILSINSCYSQETIISEDLSSFVSSNSNIQDRNGWPINGCKEFSVTITTGIGIEIETSVNHCCISGVCALESFWNIMDGVFGSDDQEKVIGKNRNVKEISILKSSKLLIGDYNVAIKKGSYIVNQKTGHIEGLKYIGIKNK